MPQERCVFREISAKKTGYRQNCVSPDFDKDGNIEILLLAMKDIAEAQGGIEELVRWTNLSPQTLVYLLNTEHPPQLDKVLDILARVKDSVQLMFAP